MARGSRRLNSPVSDANDAGYQGDGRLPVLDARLQHRLDRPWSASLGVDKLGNERYRNFHPYPLRSAIAELRFDL